MRRDSLPVRDTDGPPKRRHIFDWTDVLLGIGGALGLTIALVAVQAAVFGPATEVSESAGAELLVLLLAGAIVFALVTVALLGRRRAGLSDLGYRGASGRALAIAVGLALLIRALIAGTVVALGRLGVPVVDPQQPIGDVVSGSVVLIIGMIVVVGILTPVAEEMLFRGVVYGGLRRHLGVWPAALLSAGIFAAAHGLNLNVVVPFVFVLGVLAALLYERTGSLWPPIVLHAVNNAVGLVLIVAG